jgi:sugar diacid utilization regulator
MDGLLQSVPGAPLSEVLANLHDVDIKVLGHSSDINVQVAEIVVWDGVDGLHQSRDGVLLLVGWFPGDHRLAAAVAEAASLSYSAIVLKSRGVAIPEPLCAAERAGVVVLDADQSLPWASIERYLNAAISLCSARPNHAVADPPGDLYALADVLSTQLSAAVTIEDADRQVVAHSNVGGHPIDASRRDTILARHVWRYESEYRSLAQSVGPLFFQADGDVLARFAMPVRVAGRFIGSVWAIDGGSKTDTAEQLISWAPMVAQQMLHEARRRDHEAQRKSQWLEAQLAGDTPNRHSFPATIRQQLPAALIGFRDVGPDHRVLDSARLVRAITMTVEAATRDVWCALVDDTVFVLLSRADRFASGWLAKLASSVVDSVAQYPGVAVGCAFHASVPDYGSLPSARSDINTALRRQRSVEMPSVTDVMRQRHAVHLQSLAETGIASPGRWVPAVDQLLKHDQHHGTDYAATLLAHLDAFGDVRIAARTLGVHENSHRYRMRRLVEIFDIDLSDPELRLVVWLQLALSVGDRQKRGESPLQRRTHPD